MSSASASSTGSTHLDTISVAAIDGASAATGSLSTAVNPANTGSTTTTSSMDTSLVIAIVVGAVVVVGCIVFMIRSTQKARHRERLIMGMISTDYDHQSTGQVPMPALTWSQRDSQVLLNSQRKILISSQRKNTPTRQAAATASRTFECSSSDMSTRPLEKPHAAGSRSRATSRPLTASELISQPPSAAPERPRRASRSPYIDFDPSLHTASPKLIAVQVASDDEILRGDEEATGTSLSLETVGRMQGLARTFSLASDCSSLQLDAFSEADSTERSGLRLYDSISSSVAFEDGEAFDPSMSTTRAGVRLMAEL